MRKFALMLAVAGALLVPLTALADETPAPATVASQICSQERTTMPADAFKLLYGTNANGSNAHGKCVSTNAAGAKQDVANAAKTCKAERTANAADFAAKYGTKSNAFGKCVSALAKAAAGEEASETSSAAKSCKAALTANRAAFAAKYGSARNAFAKCVAAKEQGE